MTIATNAENFIGEIDGGIFAKQFGHVLSDVAESVLAHEGKGEVVVKFQMKPSKRSDQVEMKYVLDYKAPKAKGGNRSESTPDDTLMYVGKGGVLSTFPQNQTDMFATE